MTDDSIIRRLREERDAAREEARQMRAMVSGHGRPRWPAPRLTPAEHRILAALARTGFATRDALMAAMSLKPLEDADDPYSTLCVHLHHMRRKLAPHGVRISTVWGRGYEMDDASRDALKRIEAGDAAAHLQPGEPAA